MIYRKKTYKDITDPHILEIWEEVKAEAKALYPRFFMYCDPELYQDDSYRHLGQCWEQWRNPHEKNVDKVTHIRCIITISSNLGQDYDQIRKTLCHELGHFCAPKEKHSHLWKMRADNIGKRWGLEATRLTHNETFSNAAKQIRNEVKNKSKYQYRLYCPDCGAEWKYKTKCDKIQNPQRWRCGQCKTQLKSEKI